MVYVQEEALESAQTMEMYFCSSNKATFMNSAVVDCHFSASLNNNGISFFHYISHEYLEAGHTCTTAVMFE